MKTIAINGSPNKHGNTYWRLKTMADDLEKYDIETEIVHIGAGKIQGCTGCMKCVESKEALCVINNDIVNKTAIKIHDAEGIILGAPTYYGGIGGSMKSFLDRLFFPSMDMFANKVSSAVVALRRSGGDNALHQLHNYLLVNRTIIAPQPYWLEVHGSEPGEVIQDAEGIQNIIENARSMAWLIKLIDTNKGKMDPPPLEERILTKFNFIR